MVSGGGDGGRVGGLPLSSCSADKSLKADAISLLRPLEPVADALSFPSGSLQAADTAVATIESCHS